MSGELHPAPHRDRLRPLLAALILYTPPLAWFVQLAVGFGMTSWPCFPSMERHTTPLPGYGWTSIGTLVLLLVCALLACTTAFLSWRIFRDVREESGGGHDALAEMGQGRTRFMALWGLYLGMGFALATLVTLPAFALVPRCLG